MPPRAKYDPADYPLPGTKKLCPRCGVTKDLTPENFAVAGIAKGRKYFCWCRQCNRERSAANNADPERRVAHNQYRRRHMLRTRYDLEPEDYALILRMQGGVCKICNKPPYAKKPGGPVAPLQVDHDHFTGAVRGLLCFKCNAGLGNLCDDPALMRRAAAYVENSRA